MLADRAGATRLPRGRSGAPGGGQRAGADGQQGGAGIGTGASSTLWATSRRGSIRPARAWPCRLKLGSGPGVRPPDGTEDQTGNDPTTGARSVSELAQAQQTGQVAPEQNLVPGEQRPVVRGYFQMSRRARRRS